MVAMTTAQLLHELRRACFRSSLVNSIEERILDIEVLHVRVYLAIAETFINVFFNLETDKAAFTLIQAGKRIYGVDNAKMGWHQHPFENPNLHEPCSQKSFDEFLRELEEFFGV
jgi:hypothetical protein